MKNNIKNSESSDSRPCSDLQASKINNIIYKKNNKNNIRK